MSTDVSSRERQEEPADNGERQGRDQVTYLERVFLIPVGAPSLVSIPFYPSIIYLVWLETMVTGSPKK